MLIINIKGLVGLHPENKLVLKGNEMSRLPVLEDAWLLIEDGLIKDFGKMDQIPAPLSSLSFYDAQGKYLLPCWCDSHTHLVFAATREEEFVMKISGKTYEEIAGAGGGILNSARKLEHASEDELFESASSRLMQMIRQGTGAVEIKSGYGLSVESELKMLRVIKRIKACFPAVPVKATFLAAHAYPAIYRDDHQAYIDLIIKEMLPVVAEEQLADYIDVFCEKGFFSVEETDQILKAGAKYGLKPKIHANQLSVSGAVEVGIKNAAVSVDHLEETNEETLLNLSGSKAIATLLPSCSFYLGIPYANARAMIRGNLPVALASDFNPGSAPSGNMNFVVSLGCIKLKMSPEESINAATLNGAAAIEISDQYGSITKGKRANLFMTKKMPSLNYLPYSFGESQVETVILNGEVYHG